MYFKSVKLFWYIIVRNLYVYSHFYFNLYLIYENHLIHHVWMLVLRPRIQIWYSLAFNSAVWVSIESAHGNEIECQKVFAPPPAYPFT
jgi:hypothetical protein